MPYTNDITDEQSVGGNTGPTSAEGEETAPERVLGRDYVTMKNPGLVYNGATVKGSSHIHIGMSLTRSTLCGEAIENFFLTHRDVDVDCPECVRKAVAKEEV